MPLDIVDKVIILKERFFSRKGSEIRLKDFKISRCKICDGDNLIFQFYKNGIGIIKCEDCFSEFADLTEEEYEKFLSSVSKEVVNEGKAERNERARNIIRLQRCLQYKKRRINKILDFGCGDGSFVETLRELGYEAYGVDLLWAGEKPYIYEDLSELSKYNMTFDLLIMVEVIEHLFNPVKILSEIETMLNDQAVLYLESSFIDSKVARLKGKDWVYIDPPRHITFLSEKSVILLLKDWVDICRLNENVFLATFSKG